MACLPTLKSFSNWAASEFAFYKPLWWPCWVWWWFAPWKQTWGLFLWSSALLYAGCCTFLKWGLGSRKKDFLGCRTECRRIGFWDLRFGWLTRILDFPWNSQEYDGNTSCLTVCSWRTRLGSLVLQLKTIRKLLTCSNWKWPDGLASDKKD